MTYSMHGGAGALISVGLLRKVDFKVMERCVLGEWNTGTENHKPCCAHSPNSPVMLVLKLVSKRVGCI